jgi:hypothetical protein
MILPFQTMSSVGLVSRKTKNIIAAEDSENMMFGFKNAVVYPWYVLQVQNLRFFYAVRRVCEVSASALKN